MFTFMIFIISGFCSHLASAFTAFYSEKFGEKPGTYISFILRNISGIPLWVYGYFLAIRTSDELLYKLSFWSNIIAWLLIITGGAIIIWALISIRRKAAISTLHDSIVNTGVYAKIRHPIHCGTFLEFFGILILYPTYTVGIAFLFGCLWVYLQSRFEEKDLLKRVPGYGNYMLEVPRFIPKRRSIRKLN
ncbi:MAG: hypothetical protein JXB49_08675 [Bacteroidales bacterium]|nr:hypothetical protein [Bacteroidales bacterium]